MGEEIEGAMQQAPHPGRQFIAGSTPKAAIRRLQQARSSAAG